MTLVLSVLVCLSLSSAPSQAPDQRAEAERLARTGDYAAALKQFQAIAAAQPDDLSARTWIARLHALMGHPERAVDVYESIVAADPQNVDALVGLGNARIRLGRLTAAADALNRAEAIAADRPAVLGAQGAVHQAAGRSTLALAYYERALALDPGNQEVRAGYDRLRAARAHRVQATYYGEWFAEDVPTTHAGWLEVNARISDRFRLFASGQQQRKFREDETRGGGGFEWSPNGRVQVRAGGMFGSDATILPEGEGTLDLSYQDRRMAVLGSVRYVQFDGGVSSTIFSPGVTLFPSERTWVTLRYYRSQSDFADNSDSIGNNGVTVGGGAQVSPRAWISAKYGRGFEHHPVITAERLLEADVDTLSISARLDVVPMTSLSATYQYEWRDVWPRIGSLFVALTQRF